MKLFLWFFGQMVPYLTQDVGCGLLVEKMLFLTRIGHFMGVVKNTIDSRIDMKDAVHLSNYDL